VVGALVRTRVASNGSMVVQVRGHIGEAATAQLRRALLHALLRVRSHRLVVDLRGAGRVDPLGVGTVVAGCEVASDRSMSVVVHRPTRGVARRLRAAGLPGSALQRR
jgi:anti-anti-sigma factor